MKLIISEFDICRMWKTFYNRSTQEKTIKKQNSRFRISERLVGGSRKEGVSVEGWIRIEWREWYVFVVAF